MASWWYATWRHVDPAIGKGHRRRAGAVAIALLSGAGAAAQPGPAPLLEGVWKIVAPSTSLKPLEPVVLTAEGRKRLEANKRLRAQRKYDDYDITLSRCSSPGVPRLMLTPLRFKIWQRQGVVTFDYEWNRALRQIDVRGVPVERLLVPQMTGQSIGQWEGDTLVAQTIDVSERTLIDDLMPHTVDMKVTERLRLKDADTLEDRITIDDRAYYAKPWSAVVTYKRQPDAIFPENICLESAVKRPASSVR